MRSRNAPEPTISRAKERPSDDQRRRAEATVAAGIFPGSVLPPVRRTNASGSGSRIGSGDALVGGDKVFLRRTFAKGPHRLRIKRFGERSASGNMRAGSCDDARGDLHRCAKSPAQEHSHRAVRARNIVEDDTAHRSNRHNCGEKGAGRTE